ncbi:MAG: prepilin peptidase [Gammaproteobacteria bacterium]|nr:prepilin peptidase [Gammaproteobacteria bacterium]
MSIAGLYLSHTTWLIVTAVYGLIVGSFLNVVVHRLPIMMEREWRAGCKDILGEEFPEGVDDGSAHPPFSLLQPGSRCPRCDHRIRILENIPILSYLWLKGRCAACGQRISARYPTVELVTALLSVVVVWQLGMNLIALGGLLLTWCLIALALIDADTQFLPDHITLPLIWLGLLFNMYGGFASLQDALIGAVAGYLVLRLIYEGFKLLTGKEGMGFGDFKLLAALGAWLGWEQLPMIILLSSVVGSVAGLALIKLRNHEHQTPIPFGPYLAAAGWLAMLWGDGLAGAYMATITPPSGL